VGFGQVRQNVAEPVHEEDLTHDALIPAPNGGPWKPHRIADPRPEPDKRHADRSVRGHRGEDVARVEGPAHDLAVVGLIRGGDDDRPGTVAQEAEEAVVGTHKVVSVRQERQRTPRPADPRIDDRQMNGPWRKKGVGGRQRQRAPPDVLRRNGMGEVDELRSGVDAEKDPFDDPDVRVLEAEVRQKRHDPARAREPGRPAVPGEGRHEAQRAAAETAQFSLGTDRPPASRVPLPDPATG
jgi:hypothetical protein